jgi:hypothetical protein
MSKTGSSLRENYQRPNETVLTPAGGHDIPAAINSPGHRQGHGLSSGLKAQEPNVLTCRRPPHSESAVRRTRQPSLGPLEDGWQAKVAAFADKVTTALRARTAQ